MGLYGGWPEARRALERLRANFKKGGIQLSPEELRAMVNGQWERSVSADTDRLGVQMIEALGYEKTNQAVSLVGYRYVVEEVKEVPASHAPRSRLSSPHSTPGPVRRKP